MPVLDRLYAEVILNRLSPIELSELLSKHANALSLYARQFTEDYDDCVQEAFVELAIGERPDQPAAWLFRVVRNKSLNAARAVKRRSHHEASASRQESRFEPPEQTLEDREQQLALLECLDRLPGDHRELVVMRIWGGLTWQQIGELMQLPPSSAHRQYSLALEVLKSMLTKPMVPNHE